MGRHRRSAAGRAATGRATGVTETGGSYPGSYDPPQYSYSYDPPQTSGPGGSPGMGTAPFLDTEAYAEASARSAAYLFASEDDFATVFPEHGFTPDGGTRRGGSHRRRRKRAVTPVRSGLLGVSAAVALGTVAVSTGAVPGLDNYKLGGGSSSSGDKVQAAGSPTNSASEQGGTSGSADSRAAGSSTSRGTGRTASPSSPAPSTSTAAPSEAPTTQRPKPKPEPGKARKPKTTPSKKQTSKPAQTAAPAVTVSAATAAEAEVLRLVNDERAKVGCSALAANSSLGELAGDFSDAMAEEGFFDHTDPSGATPWDRAAKLGISNLGGENIARGQTDPAAVMDAWMNSPGHRANILNCDFKTLGVGVHFGSGGPWWTQDFGY
ncbi:CAP domain-containing protein [Streptomyces sp. NPDC020996]|uniref:CAP domain-containing protein n=1 Tax=Streptomyces sp. NPDC020996 TaxID=3154791 RepID=UPI0033E3B685